MIDRIIGDHGIIGDMQSYEQGYRRALEDTVKHIEGRMNEEKQHADEWNNHNEYLEYIRALRDCKMYIEWVLDLEPKRTSREI